MNSLNLILKEEKGKQIIAGPTSSGKTKLCRMLAKTEGYFHYDYEGNWGTNPISQSGKDWEDMLTGMGYKGVIFDVPAYMIEKTVTDWNDYEWNMPVCVTKQLNRKAMEKVEV